jgi:tetratricopeptide (TPR) repeat protein
MSGGEGGMQTAEPSTARPLADGDLGETLRAYLRSSEAEPGPRAEETGAGRAPRAWSLEPVGPVVAEEPSPTPASGAGIPERDATPDAITTPIARPRSRTWFLAGAGLLIALTLGAIGYLAAELRAPVPIARGAAAATGDTPQAARTPQPGPVEDIPGLPRADAGAPNSPAAQAAVPTPRAHDASPDPPASKLRSSSPHAAKDASAERRIEQQRVPRVHPRLAAGYDALRSRELERARGAYLEALHEDPLNRDALLGLAAIETYAQRRPQAQAYLQSLLRAEPRDPHGRAALIALRSESADARWAEKELESLLLQEPESATLQFALGNQYARQRRWAEARQAYLRALDRDPGDPDIAFNLAIACDHLGLVSDARAYYGRALEAASRRVAVFPADAAARRLATLAR